MSEPFTIHVFVPDGDPQGVKVVERLNWTGVGVAFPRLSWAQCKKRPEFELSGVYVLTGTAEGAGDDLPTVYIGQGETVANRIQTHSQEKEFWDWGYAFVSNGNPLNKAHTTWLEYELLQRAKNAKRCHLDNGNLPNEPGLSEAEKADTTGFLKEMLRILLLLGVHVFERPKPVVQNLSASASVASLDDRDTVVVPAQKAGFQRVFLGEDCWHAIRIGGGMLDRIKYIAAYQSNPVSAVTHYAPVKQIEPYGDRGKYRLIFSEPAQVIGPIPLADAPSGSMQGPRYTTLAKLKAAKKVADLFSGPAHQE